MLILPGTVVVLKVIWHTDNTDCMDKRRFISEYQIIIKMIFSFIRNKSAKSAYFRETASIHNLNPIS
jgi:hypothetical protein